MILKRFQPGDLEDLVLQPAQEYARHDLARKGYGEALAQHDAFTACLDGRVIACAGVLPIWEGRGEAWALIARDIGPYGMRAWHYAVRRYVESSSLRRIEAACEITFEQAHRWLVLLGFECEGPAKKYTPQGKDCMRFARVK